jgi:hypothetical protein
MISGPGPIIKGLETPTATLMLLIKGLDAIINELFMSA